MLNDRSPQTDHHPQGGTDQRYFPRWEVKNRVVYQTATEEVETECESKDLSCAGICIATKEKLTPQQRVKLTIYLAQEKMVNVEGNVIWNRPWGTRNFAGIVFANMSVATQELILRHAFTIKKNEVIHHWFEGWDQ